MSILDAGDGLKREAAVRAAGYVHAGMRVGLGTGSTVRYLLDELGRRHARGELEGIVGVPTSEHTAARARALGIPVGSLERYPQLDLTIDGADEVDPELRLIKGLGGALLREKIVAAVSSEMIVIIDESKRVERLGTRAPVPVEVDEFGAAVQPSFLRGLGAEPTLRMDASGRPFRTDGGNLIFDCLFPEGIDDPAGIAGELSARPGVLEHGIFLDFATRVLVGTPGGIEVVERERR
jgi:ribose 5-phosphate isomerase A